MAAFGEGASGPRADRPALLLSPAAIFGGWSFSSEKRCRRDDALLFAGIKKRNVMSMASLVAPRFSMRV